MQNTPSIEEIKHQFEQLATFLPLAVALFDSDMCYLFANQRWMEDYHLDGQDIIGHSHYEVFPEIVDEWKTIHQQCLQGHIHKDDAVLFQRMDGSSEWISREIRPWTYHDGRIGGLILYSEVITRRKQTEEALQQQHRFLRQVMDLNTSFVFAKDRDGYFTLVNQALADAYGSTVEGIDGKSDKDFNPDTEQVKNIRHDDLEVLHTRQPKFIAEEPVTHADGQTRWYQTTKIPLISEDGQDVQLLGIATDITERKQVQDALHKQSRFLRQVIDLNTSFVFAKDTDGNYTLVNQALADAYGSTPEKMVGTSDKDYNPDAEQVKNIERDDLEVIHSRLPKFNFEEPVTHADGQMRWYQTTKIPLASDDGAEVQLLGIATDITERKQAQDKLRDQHRFLRQVIDLNTSLIFAKDEQGNFTLVNKTLADAFGVEPDDMVGKSDKDYNPDPEQVKNIRRDDLEALSTRQPKFIAQEPITGTVTGETRWYQTIKVPLISEDGERVQLVGVATDITERKQAQEQLEKLVVQEQEARQAAEAASKLKDLFLANMSHELRTPLNAIIGFVREMLYSQQLDADNTHMAERSLANGKRLSMLINSVLDLSRLAVGSLELVVTPVDLPYLAHMIRDDLSIQAKEKGLEFKLKLDESLPQSIWHDEERLTQIISNLLVNAIKYTDSGYVELSFGRKNDDRFLIQVSDTGIGIPSDLHSHIFENFVQVNEDKRAEGAGLGLSIVKNLVDLMGGWVTLRSEVNAYSTFTVELPLNLPRDA